MNFFLCFTTFLVLLPAIIYTRNVRLYRPPKRMDGFSCPPVSILIPARNEEKSIQAAIESVLSSTSIEWELIVLDDHSEDQTGRIVQNIAQLDSRVQLQLAPELPPGWCGKQHACYTLSQHARYDIFAFMDADVRLAPDGIARMVRFLVESKAELISGFPHQETGTILEKLLIPLIHFLLLGFLPIKRMRQSSDPGFAAGCGQLMLTQRKSYEKVGGHRVIQSSLHDGITLPRAFRKQGYLTDICDATEVATCRMYRSASQVWFGLAKNAREGLAAPKMIIPATLFLFIPQILPFVLICFAEVLETTEVCLLIVAIILGYYIRIDAAIRFRQSTIGALLHPLGMLLLLAIQWYATIRAWIGKSSSWKGRTYAQGQAGSNSTGVIDTNSNHA